MDLYFLLGFLNNFFVCWLVLLVGYFIVVVCFYFIFNFNFGKCHVGQSSLEFYIIKDDLKILILLSSLFRY